MSKYNVPICEKVSLTLEEAAAYSEIRINKLREITDDKRCGFVFFVGSKRMIKRERFDAFINDAYSL